MAVVAAPARCVDPGDACAVWRGGIVMPDGWEGVIGAASGTTAGTTDGSEAESRALPVESGDSASQQAAQVEGITSRDIGLRAAGCTKTDGSSDKGRVRWAKLGFAAGAANLCLIFYWLGYSRSTFYRLYTAESMILFSARWVTFKREKKHYYMFDFCYAANALLMLFLWGWPQCVWLHKVLFAYNAGPLAWSIVAFQNSIVFHSLYEWTSLLIHWYPMLVSWVLRWDEGSCELYSTCDVTTAGWWEWTNVAERWSWNDLFELGVLPMAPYLVWATLYYLKIFVISSKKIEQRGYETLYKYTTTEHALCKKVIHRYPLRLQPLAYMGYHSLLCWSSMAISVIFWYFPWVHTGLILVTTGASFWNGASYYLEASVVLEDSQACGAKDKRK
ncbi:unnamed protein product [Ostreobium quekettii]|uniref:Glycerophosphocholine acyltransferase 1 n=1 Tax=Ostreobium quekettii TaxID=121088 RepID=A0A8S1IY53_9CHLO|nr:unnamed protein product [Ostreobium quekettii]